VLIDRTQAVKTDLWVIDRADRDPGAVLEVDHLHEGLRDDHDVTRSEALGNPLGEVEPLLQQQLGVLAVRPSGVEPLGDSLDIEVYVLLHLSGEARVLPKLLQEGAYRALRRVARDGAELGLSELVGKGAQLRVLGCRVLELRLKARGGRTGHPAVRAGRGQKGMVGHQFASLAAWI